MASQIKKGRQYLKNGYWAMVGALSAMIISLQPVMADTIWDRFSNIMRDIYGQLAGISTIAVSYTHLLQILRAQIGQRAKPKRRDNYRKDTAQQQSRAAAAVAHVKAAPNNGQRIPAPIQRKKSGADEKGGASGAPCEQRLDAVSYTHLERDAPLDRPLAVRPRLLGLAAALRAAAPPRHTGIRGASPAR